MNDITYGFISGAGIGIIVVAVILYFKWLFIRSAVESGTERAIENMLRKYTDLSDYMKEPLNPEPPDNSFEKDLHGWPSFKK